MSEPLHVNIQGVCQDFQGDHGVDHVVKDVSFQAGGTETVAILGPSGCGKSTIIRMVSGMYPRGIQMPTLGCVTIDGEHVKGPRDDVVTVFQSPVLAPWMTVLGNVMLPFKAQLWGEGISPEDQKKRAVEILEAVGLKDSLHKRPNQLSGGMRQRASLAQALVVRPRILCMDEPFSALDPTNSIVMRGLVRELKAKYPCMVMFVTHNVGEALDLADRIIVLSTRPATILLNTTVDAPSPRPGKWNLTPEYAAKEARILQLIREASQGQNNGGTLTVGV